MGASGLGCGPCHLFAELAEGVLLPRHVHLWSATGSFCKIARVESLADGNERRHVVPLLLRVGDIGREPSGLHLLLRLVIVSVGCLSMLRDVLAPAEIAEHSEQCKGQQMYNQKLENRKRSLELVFMSFAR